VLDAAALVERLEPYGSDLDERIVAATLDCVARWGLAKTTLDDIARAAGCSRATVYRTFPGGKGSLIEHAGHRELERFFVALAGALAEVDTLEDAVVVAVCEASRGIRGHAALQYLIQHESDVLLPYISFDGINPLLAWSADFAAVHLARFIGPDHARDLGEWACRIILTYSDLDARVRVDLGDPVTAREFVRTFVLPGVAAMSGSTATRSSASPPAAPSGPATVTGSAPVAELALATASGPSSTARPVQARPSITDPTLRPAPALENLEE
jgi:AcrR family transcriptional regulator